MPSIGTNVDSERAELETVLKSGIFSRSPILASLLEYICKRYFEGDADGLREYCIAVDALDRSPDFDQKKNAIVRVEIHRLRKRLADYYLGDGRSHAIHIEIPIGQYAPRFVRCDQQQELREPLEEASPTPPQTVGPQEPGDETAVQGTSKGTPRKATPFRWAALGAVAALVALTMLLAIQAAKRSKIEPLAPDARRQPEIWAGSSKPISGDFRLLAGYHGVPFTDRQGRVWSPDSYYNGGISINLGRHRGFENLPDPDLPVSQRVGAELDYSVPVSPGVYEVRLYFLDTPAADVNGPGVNLLSVLLNGKPVLERIDPVSDAGGRGRLTCRVLSDVKAAPDGRIHLRIVQEGSSAKLSGLEILASAPGHVVPFRIVAATHSVTDEQGIHWLADEGAIGGTIIERDGIVQEDAMRAIYVGERFGNFAYHIPFPPGKYRVKLYFAESYFNEKILMKGPQDGFTCRVFNVFADGITLLRHFNVMQAAGGSHRALVKTFEGLEPNAQGQIVLQFVPVSNYAEVNAIEATKMNE